MMDSGRKVALEAVRQWALARLNGRAAGHVDHTSKFADAAAAEAEFELHGLVADLSSANTFGLL
jgi:hypothetical protein